MIIKNIVAFFFLVSSTIPVYSQNPDSLETLLSKTSGIARADLLYDFNRALFAKDNYHACKFGLEAFDISKNHKDSLRMVRTGALAAKTLRVMGQYDSAVQVYEMTLPIARKKRYFDPHLTIINGYALALTFKAQYDKALSLHFESLDISSAEGDSSSIAITLHNIGLVFYKLKQYNAALKYFLLSENLKTRTSDKHDMDMLMTNIGLCYAYLGCSSEAQFYVKTALNRCSSNCPPARIMESEFALGVIHFGLASDVDAEKHFITSYTMAKNQNDIRFQLDNILFLAELYHRQGRNLGALVYLKVGERLLDEYPSLNLERMKVYHGFSEVYAKTRDFERALVYRLRADEVKDSVYSTEMTANLMRLQAEHLERENMARISAQGELIAAKEEVIRRQDMLNKMVSLLAVVFVILVVVLFWNYRYKQKLNVLLDKRINERTRELLKSNANLKRAFEEKDMALHRSSREVDDILITIRGLCGLVKRQARDPATVLACMQKLELIVRNSHVQANSSSGHELMTRD